jgi:protocatechuate 3,4-dioxygenase alpha subunit
VGPFFGVGSLWLDGSRLAPAGVLGERVRIEGRVLDGDGGGVPDALLEVWQASAHGRYAHPEDVQPLPIDPGFTGFGRVATDATGRFQFATVKPGSVPGPRGSRQAPHILVSLFARGLMRRLVTRLYFPNDPANAGDFVLGLVPVARRATLIARARTEGVVEWDVVLQGPNETVFFDCF